MANELQRLLYQSAARIGRFSIEHRRILEQSLRHNAIAGITGHLHREGDLFLGVLEGPPAAISDLLTRLMADQRHAEIVVRLRERIEERAFPVWTMGFSDDVLHSFARLHAEEGDVQSAPSVVLLAFLREAQEDLREDDDPADDPLDPI